MEELVVINVSDRTYTLEHATTKQQYVFKIKFFDLEKEVIAGDILVVNPCLLDETYVEYSTKLQFGALDEPYGRKIDSRDHKDLLCVKKDGEEYWLKRFFG